MPFFFLVSGYLHKKEESLIPLIKKLSKRLLVPFGVFLFIGYLYFVVVSQSLAIGVAKGSVKGIIFGSDIVANDILWFLLALFHVRIMDSSFIRKPFPAILVYCILSVVFNSFHINILYIGTSLMALPFYLWGYYGKTLTNRIVESKWSVLFSVVFLFLTVLMSRYNGKVSMMGMSYGKLNMDILRIVFFYVNGIVGSYMLLCLVGGVKKENRRLLLPSKCAISIVGLQAIPIMIWYSTIGFNQKFFLSFAYAALIMLICILFHLFVEKRANWIIGGR
jgi:fucose 4-O-acetylase-like acetyltransferase